VGQRLEREASGELRNLGVSDPEKWSSAYFSPFSMAQAEPLTIHETRS
jgi:hypothetical protein